MIEYLKPVLSTVIGVALGFVLAKISTYLQRRGRLRAHWGALGAEIQLCECLGRTYLADDVASPLYRLPTMAFAASLPALLADGAVTAAEVNYLERFLIWAQDINRGLDNANHLAMQADGSDGLKAEVARLRQKCTQLVEGSGGNAAYAAEARRVIAAHVCVGSDFRQRRVGR